MIKKLIVIIILVTMLLSCDNFLSFFTAPGYNIPAKRVKWVVDNVNSTIIGDSEYFPANSYDPYDSDSIGSFHWNSTANTLYFEEIDDNDYNRSIRDFPFEMQKNDRINSPLFYFKFLFGLNAEYESDIHYSYDKGSGEVSYYDNINGINVNIDYSFDITTGGTSPEQSLNIAWDDVNEYTSANYSITKTARREEVYILPEPAYLGIAGNIVKTELTGSLNILEFEISSDYEFISGQAVCVFASAENSSDPAGLLYLVYYHGNGLVSLIYAHEVETTETGNYFPDGHYEYIWSVYTEN